LLLADIGQKEKVEVSEQELSQAVMAEAQNFPGREREFFDFVRQNRGALERIRAPLFEDKVCDLIIEKADITDVSVTKEALQTEMEELESDL
ncbi:MAG: trigger factor, partial [Pseudomonadota bacterium]